ncbi:MAG: twin-arginine translocase TatA/TatE family subunit [bacterium]|nr:twin-arginine translocase TatA/TatE family subunit [bacterium]
MFGLGVQELIVILAILLLLFGGKKLPELSKSVGQTIKDIRKGFDSETNDSKEKAKAKDNSKK